MTDVHQGRWSLFTRSTYHMTQGCEEFTNYVSSVNLRAVMIVATVRGRKLHALQWLMKMLHTASTPQYFMITAMQLAMETLGTNLHVLLVCSPDLLQQVTAYIQVTHLVSVQDGCHAICISHDRIWRRSIL